MSESLHDYVRLRATEAQMRRALGLPANTQVRSTPIQVTGATYGSHRQGRRFIGDGEVPVTFIRRNRYPVGELRQVPSHRRILPSSLCAVRIVRR